MFYAGAAGAQGSVTLVCASAPSAPGGFQIVVNYNQSTVHFMGATHPARISENRIAGQTSRYEPGDGEVRPAASYAIDRVTGQLQTQVRCPPRDASWNCGWAQPVSYCKRGARQF